MKVVKNMPIQSGPNKPTVAIITSKYYEKLAVDAMMENKTTFVRFKSEGMSKKISIREPNTTLDESLAVRLCKILHIGLNEHAAEINE